MALEAIALSRITIANHGRVAYSWIDQADFIATGAGPEETEPLVDAVRVLGGVDVVALFRIAEGEVRVNLRSKTGFDVGAVARRFGGGGHEAASGFTAGGTMSALLPRLLAVLPGGGPE
jgi:phosphoesterase RecJ-like protein